MARTLRPFQAEALASLSQSEIHLALTAPTGSGKGVVLEELGKIENERIVLITPLIALARQQCRRFETVKIPHHSSVGRGNRIDPGPGPTDRIWVLSPESAILPKRTERIADWRPTLIAVDEAHCLEEWGEAFRPAYSSLCSWVRTIEARRTLWMSATFPRSLFARLAASIPGRWKTQGAFSLPPSLSVSIERIPYSERIEIVRDRIFSRESPGILFAGTRRSSENYTRILAEWGKPVIPYHAGMADEERRAVEGLLESTKNSGMSPSVVATNAFGMGMDFPQLEWTTLARTPLSLLALMQAFGRVARAGKPGLAEVLWAEEDFRIAGFLVAQNANRTAAEERLADLRRYLEAGALERRRLLEQIFL